MASGSVLTAHTTLRIKMR